jgi:macrolide transport system ATP-binding/permease protein
VSLIRELFSRLFAPFRKAALDQELDKDLHEHLEMLVGEYRERGMNEQEARRAARIRFGGIEQIKEMHREQRGLQSLETLSQDVRYAVRQMRRTPGFALVAVLTTALAIGMNAGIFSVLNALAFHPVAVRGGERLVSVYPIFQGRKIRHTSGSIHMFSYAEYKAYRDENHVFSSLAGYVPFVDAAVSGELATDVSGSLATCNYFDVLNQHPVLGRGFVDGDCEIAGGTPVVVLSNDFWRGHFAADRDVLASTISLNHTVFRIVGVAPPGFVGTEIAPSAFWAPITMQVALMPGRAFLDNPDLSWIAVLGGPKPGITLDQVRADLNVITNRLDAQHPGTMKVMVREATLFNRPEERAFVLNVGVVLLIAVTMVLLIACANVANFLLARAAGRRRELAVRLALGASRGRLVRQLLTESVLLSLIGGALGMLISFATFGSLVRFVIEHLPAGLPPMALTLSPDARVLSYCFFVTLITGVVFGSAPALRSSRAEVSVDLKATGGGEALRARRGELLRNVFVSVQVAVCMILLLVAGLLLHGLYEAQTIEPGFERKGISAVTLHLEQQGYGKPQAEALHHRIKDALSALPGVDSMAETESIPLGNEHFGTLAHLPTNAQDQPVSYNRVSPNFFSMLGIPILRGRTFTRTEVQTDSHVVIVSEELARRLWPGADPVGKTLQLLGEGTLPKEVIGVVKDTQVDHLGESHPRFLYMPIDGRVGASKQFLVHSTLDEAAALQGMRRTIRILDPNLSFSVVPLEDNLDAFRALSRIVVAVAGLLGGLALILTTIGVFGLVAYSVSQRTREIGIRMALGADSQGVVRMIVRQALLPVVLGAVVGIASCAAVSRVFSSLLFGVSPFDSISFVGVPLFLLGVATIASYIPARRGTRVDPLLALRYE